MRLILVVAALCGCLVMFAAPPSRAESDSVDVYYFDEQASGVWSSGAVIAAPRWWCFAVADLVTPAVSRGAHMFIRVSDTDPTRAEIFLFGLARPETAPPSVEVQFDRGDTFLVEMLRLRSDQSVFFPHPVLGQLDPSEAIGFAAGPEILEQLVGAEEMIVAAPNGRLVVPVEDAARAVAALDACVAQAE